MSLSKRARKALVITAVTTALAVTGFGANAAMADPAGGEDIELELNGATGYFNADATMAYLHDSEEPDFNPRLYIFTENGDDERKHVLELTSMEETNALQLKIEDGTTVRLRLCPTEKEVEFECTDWAETVV